MLISRFGRGKRRNNPDGPEEGSSGLGIVPAPSALEPLNREVLYFLVLRPFDPAIQPSTGELPRLLRALVFVTWSYPP